MTRGHLGQGRTWLRGAVAVLTLVAATGAHGESLRAAVQSAVTSTPTARVHSADVRASAYELMQNERNYLPTVTATANAQTSYYNDPARLSPANNGRVSLGAELGVVAEYTLFDGYARANQVYRDAARVDEAVFSLLDASETLALNAVEAYVDVLRHRQLVGLAGSNVSRHVDIQRQIAELADSGGLPVSERFEADQRVMAAKLTLVRMREALANAEARYEAAVGHGPKGAMSLPHVSGLPMTMEAYLTRAVRGSFAVKAAEKVIQQKGYELVIGKSGDLPQVVARAGASIGQNLDGVPGRQTEAYVGVGLEWEVYSAGRKARDSALLMRQVQAQALRDKAVLDARALARTTWNAYHANIERTVLINRQVSATRATVEQYSTQFEAGSRSLLDVLDAERSWFNARFEEVSANASYLFNQYQMLAVEGRLAAHFGVKPADVALAPDFEARALETGAYQVFSTDIPALK